MKRILAVILSVIMVLSLSFGALAEETSSGNKQAQVIEAIRAFESEHPELKEKFELINRDIMEIFTDEFGMAFKIIQARFGEMLEENRKQLGITDEAHEEMKQKLEMLAQVINASFIANVKNSEIMMAGTLSDPDYKPEAFDAMSVLEALVKEDAGEENTARRAAISKILEKVKNEYNGDIKALYQELTARPELPEGVEGKPADESRPPRPGEGEGKPEGEKPENGGIPFNDHFSVILEELKAAAARVDERVQALAEEAPEKYGIDKAITDEMFKLLNSFFVAVNEQIVKMLAEQDAAMREAMGGPEQK